MCVHSFLFSCLLRYSAQSTHDALRKLQEEELALQADEAGIRKYGLFAMKALCQCLPSSETMCVSAGMFKPAKRSTLLSRSAWTRQIARQRSCSHSCKPSAASVMVWLSGMACCRNRTLKQSLKWAGASLTLHNPAGNVYVCVCVCVCVTLVNPGQASLGARGASKGDCAARAGSADGR